MQHISWLGVGEQAGYVSYGVLVKNNIFGARQWARRVRLAPRAAARRRCNARCLFGVISCASARRGAVHARAPRANDNHSAAASRPARPLRTFCRRNILRIRARNLPLIPLVSLPTTPACLPPASCPPSARPARPARPARSVAPTAAPRPPNPGHYPC